MKAKKAAIIFGTLTLLGSVSASAADLRGSLNAPVFDRPSYSVDAKPKPRRLETRKIVKHTCESQGYTCGSGYTCDLIMSRNFEDAQGRAVELGHNRTNLRFYSCNKTGRAGPPTCSLGLTPSGGFISALGDDLRQLGGVESYFCQNAL
jgi:hypothetical protein